MEMVLPQGKHLQCNMVVEECAACDGGNFGLFEDEVPYLQEQIPFLCAHGRQVTSFRRSVDLSGPALPCPRPGFPMLPASSGGAEATVRLAAPSLVCSTITMPKLEARCKALQEQLHALARAHSNLVGAVEDTEEQIAGYPDLSQESLEVYLDAWQVEVTSCTTRAEMILDALDRLKEVEDEVEEQGGQPQLHDAGTEEDLQHQHPEEQLAGGLSGALLRHSLGADTPPAFTSNFARRLSLSLPASEATDGPNQNPHGL